MGLWQELRRRHVDRVVSVYLVVAFAVLQVASLTFGPLRLPAWALTLVVALAILGLPVVAALAWAFDVGPDGLHATRDVATPDGRPAAGFVAAIFVLTLAAAGGAWLWLGSAAGGPGSATGASPSAARPGPPADRAAGRTAGPAGAAESAQKTVAVLPFENLSPDPDDAYFAGAMTEEITSALSKVPGLRVTSRTSAARFADEQESVPEIGRRLGVRYVLEGSARRAKDRVAIVVQLIDTRTDEHLWTERYEREMKDVLGLQVEIAHSVADELRSAFTERERERIRAGATDDPVAYDLALRAYSAFGVDPSRIPEAMDLLRRAVERDPDYADAWFNLGIFYRFSAGRLGPSALDSSRAAMDRAVRAVRDSSVGLAMRAVRAWLLGDDSPGAVADLRRAVEANPGDVILTQALAKVSRARGDMVEGTRWGLRWRDLDPMNSEPWAFLGEVLRQAGLGDEAGAVLGRALELDRSNAGAWLDLIQVREAGGHLAAALATIDSAAAAADFPIASAMKGVFELWAGHPERARRLLEPAIETAWETYWPATPELVLARRLTGDTAGNAELVRRAEGVVRSWPEQVDADYLLIQLAAVEGDAAEAVRRLRAYVEIGGREAEELERDPVLDRVRANPAFQAEFGRLRERAERDRREISRLLEEHGDRAVARHP